MFCFLEIIEKIIKLFEVYGPEPHKLWIGPYFAVTIGKPEDLQVIILIKIANKSYFNELNKRVGISK